jgi:hypothetical protein
MKHVILTFFLVLSSITSFAQYRSSNTSVVTYNPYPTLPNSVQPQYKHFNSGIYLGVGGVVDEPMNQRVVGSLMLVGDNYTATSFSAAFNQMTDKMEYTMIIYIKLF